MRIENIKNVNDLTSRELIEVNAGTFVVATAIAVVCSYLFLGLVCIKQTNKTKKLDKLRDGFGRA